MIKISEDFFSNSLIFSPTTNFVIPEEIKNPRYGYSPRLDEFRYENVYRGSELEENLKAHKLELELRKNSKAVGRSDVVSSFLGFGPIGVDGIPFAAKPQFIPMYILEYYLKTTVKPEVTPLVYIRAVKEYNIRHDLNEMYLRPLDYFYIPNTINTPVIERFYHPFSLNAYNKYLSEYDNETLTTWEKINLAIFNTANFRELPLRELQRILLFLNKHYVNKDNSEIEKYERKFFVNSVLTEKFLGVPREVWICAIFNELEKREKEYIELIEKPENVLFTI